MRLGVASYCLPVIAIGPCSRSSSTGETPKIILAALSVFFTTLVGTLVGLRSADPIALDVVHAYGGGSFQKLIKVRIRAALPSLFAALRIAAPAAVLGAIIGEYLGAESGLGIAMINSEQALQIATTWGDRARRDRHRGRRLRRHRAGRPVAHAVGAEGKRMTAPVVDPTDLAAAVAPRRAPPAATNADRGGLAPPALVGAISIGVVLLAWRLFLIIFHVDHFIGGGRSTCGAT